jgi:preprotein translocase subunit SecD
MSAASARAFFDLTKNDIGRKAAVMIDGRVVVEPLILAAMGPNSQISGDFDIEEARSVTPRLSDGGRGR